MPLELPTPEAHTSPIRSASDRDVIDVIDMLERTAPLPTVAGYDVLRELGRGGMGVVYLARDPRLNRAVALKTVRRDRTDTLARFADEARAVARLHHPAVVPVYASGEFDGGLFLVMEYLPGGSLAHWLVGQPCSAHTAARIVSRLCDAVQAAHEAGVLHRDIKPANVLLEKPCSRSVGDEPQVKLADFGLARIEGASPKTATGDALGTPNYMSPEQAVGNRGQIGPASDVYGLGAVLYECLTGRAPFQGVTPLDIVLQVVDHEPVPVRLLNPNVPRDLETICQKCLAKEPGKRYPSARELADDLGRFLDDQPVTARPLGVAARLGRWARLRPVFALLLLGGMLTVLVTLGWVIVASGRLHELQTRAEASIGRERRQRELAWRTLDALSLPSIEPGSLGRWNLDVGRRHMLGEIELQLEEFAKDESPETAAQAWLRLATLRAASRQLNAESAAIEACGRFQTIVEENPDEGSARRRLAEAWQTLGEIRLRQGRTGSDALAKALAMWQEITSAEPADAASRQSFAVTLLLDAERLRQGSRSAEEKACYRRALSVLAGLPDGTARPEAYNRICALVHLRLAQRLTWENQELAAEEQFHLANAGYEALSSSITTEPAVILERSACSCGLARSLHRRSQFAEAEATSREALVGYRQCAAIWSGDAATRYDLAMCLLTLGRARTRNEKREGIEEPWLESLTLSRALCLENPENHEFAHLAGEVGVELAYRHRVALRIAVAEPLYSEAIGRLKWLQERPRFGEQSRKWLCHGYWGRAATNLGLEAYDLAAADLRAAIELARDDSERDWYRYSLLQMLVHAQQTGVVVEMSEALLLRDGVKAEYLAGVARSAAIAAGQDANPEMLARARKAALTALKRVGPPSDPEHADWNAIRDEPEFQTLLKKP